ncbi:MAG: 4Fe-4S dicluster domain-containing protein [Planctomycetota bacterium]|nr:4Fe-4S dicluster domain-containing protein [Planctomycetota bacterium]MDI6786802.1 4Fe-4S dicluster domain-containing protein [Planctomycetota bacterium]
MAQEYAYKVNPPAKVGAGRGDFTMQCFKKKMVSKLWTIYYDCSINKDEDDMRQKKILIAEKSRPKENSVIAVPKGEMWLFNDRCKSCGFCIYFCPKKVIEFSEGGGEFNRKGYRLPVIKNPVDCIGCNQCTIFCPDLAIFFYPTGTKYERKR